MLAIGPHALKSRFMLAPMAGVSEEPFRVLAFEMGAGLCPTELVSSQGLMRMTKRTLRYLRHDSHVERPYSVQLFGGEPEVMAKAAVSARSLGAEIIDVNMGCPVKKVTKGGAGSALLCDPERAADIVRQIRLATALPVTAKIRLGWDSARKNFLEVVAALDGAGVSAVALHARTRAQGYSGEADWSAIAELKRHFPRLPIVGNGDVRNLADARRMLDSTGCDFVMVGRAALGNPWIFRELLGGPGPSCEERAAVVTRHFRRHLELAMDSKSGVRAFRKHLGWYARGLRNAASFRAGVNGLESPAEVEETVQRFFGTAAADVEAAQDAEVDLTAALG